MGAIQKEKRVNEIRVLEAVLVVPESEYGGQREDGPRNGQNALGFNALAGASLQLQPPAPKGQQESHSSPIDSKLYGRRLMQAMILA
jgi:hypothetical protein